MEYEANEDRYVCECPLARGVRPYLSTLLVPRVQSRCSPEHEDGPPTGQGNAAVSGNKREMLTVFLFDERTSDQVEDWGAALERLTDDELLWFVLRDPTDKEVAALQEALELGDENAHRLLQQPSRASLADAGERLHVTLYAAGIDGADPVLVPVECVLGPNWVVTAHSEVVEVLEDFRERAEGGGQVGALDAPSFVAAIFEWVVASYFRAFEAVERELEDLDTKIMSGTPKDVPGELARLVEIRRSIGALRRALSPHREIAVALAHPEFDPLSTEGSAKRFAAIESRLTQALDAAREMKESTFGSFDLLVARIGQRTNDIMKLLTLATVILLPSTVLAGIMGMNFKVGLFNTAWLFWAVLAAMLGIAVLVLSVARNRSWI
jgi:magnesium transporter